MKRIRNVLISGMMIWVFTGPSALLNAQTTINDVINTFNDGAQLVSDGSFEDAVAKFEECYDLATELGDEGNNMKTKAGSQIPGLYYRMATDSYKAKDVNGAIKYFILAKEAGDKYGDEEISNKSDRTIPQLYNLLGKRELRSEMFDKALNYFDSALIWNPEYSQAIYYKGMVYKSSGDEQQMIELMNKSIKVGQQNGDNRTVQAASQNLRDYYYGKAGESVSTEDYTTAIELFKKCLEYDSEYPEPYYYKAVIYNKKLEYDKALENTQNALKYEKDDKSKIWFEIGNAYSGNVEYDKACEAYSHCTTEPTLSKAKHKMEDVLNCQ